MPLKSSSSHVDYRYFELAVTLTAWVLWGVALSVGIAFWPEWWALGTGIGLFMLGGELAKKTPRLAYWWVLRSRPMVSRGRPGIDVLLFDAEEVATVEKVKLIADDAGMIWVEGGCYRISLQRGDYTVPFARLAHEPLVRGGKVIAMLLRFSPPGLEQWVEFAATVKYPGREMEVNTDRERRCAWGEEVLEGMKQRMC